MSGQNSDPLSAPRNASEQANAAEGTAEGPVTGEQAVGTGEIADRDTAAAGVERELVMMFRRARKLSLSVASEVHPELDPASYSLLLMVDDAGALRGMDVADRAGLDKSTVSRQIATLVGLDLLERVPDPDDGRARLVQLSAAGKARLDAVRSRRGERLREVFAQWSTSDLHELGRLLGKLNGMY